MTDLTSVQRVVTPSAGTTACAPVAGDCCAGLYVPCSVGLPAWPAAPSRYVGIVTIPPEGPLRVEVDFNYGGHTGNTGVVYLSPKQGNRTGMDPRIRGRLLVSTVSGWCFVRLIPRPSVTTVGRSAIWRSPERWLAPTTTTVGERSMSGLPCLGCTRMVQKDRPEGAVFR
jgi:hypothetical protein